jgi:hypothetical protein
MASRGPGASNRRAGLTWQRACATWLRTHGYPDATSSTRGTDVVAGPVAVECTITSWEQIWGKLRQASMQSDRDFPAVWRKRNREPGMVGAVDPGCGAVIMEAAYFWGLVGRLEAAEQRATEAERDLERWMSRERAS